MLPSTTTQKKLNKTVKYNTKHDFNINHKKEKKKLKNIFGRQL